jgi:hypothetical protein
MLGRILVATTLICLLLLVACGGYGNDSNTPDPGTTNTPSISALSPASVQAGSGAFTLTVNGSNFDSLASVRWNDVVRATTYVSANQLTAQISAADVQSPGTASVKVVNYSGQISNTVTFTITQ